MGHQLDLEEIYGIDGNNVYCPNCKNQALQPFDDYDVDCSDVFQGNGVVKLSCYCDTCDFEWDYNFKVKAEELKNE